MDHRLPLVPIAPGDICRGLGLFHLGPRDPVGLGLGLRGGHRAQVHQAVHGGGQAGGHPGVFQGHLEETGKDWGH